MALTQEIKNSYKASEDILYRAAGKVRDTIKSCEHLCQVYALEEFSNAVFQLDLALRKIETQRGVIEDALKEEKVATE